MDNKVFDPLPVFLRKLIFHLQYSLNTIVVRSSYYCNAAIHSTPAFTNFCLSRAENFQNPPHYFCLTFHPSSSLLNSTLFQKSTGLDACIDIQPDLDGAVKKVFENKTKLSLKPYSIEATRQETKVCCPYFLRREETFVKMSRDLSCGWSSSSSECGYCQTLLETVDTILYCNADVKDGQIYFSVCNCL